MSVNRASFGSGNGVSPVRRQTITWSIACLLSIRLLATNVSEIRIGIISFSLMKMHLKLSSAKMAVILSRGRWVNNVDYPISHAYLLLAMLWLYQYSLLVCMLYFLYTPGFLCCHKCSVKSPQCQWCNLRIISISRYHLTGIWILIINIRRNHDRLIFLTETHIPRKTVFILRQGTGRHMWYRSIYRHNKTQQRTAPVYNSCVARYVPFKHYSHVIMGAMASQITRVSGVYSTVCTGVDQRKYQSSASLAFARGIHRWLVNSPNKGLVMWKMIPFDHVIMKDPNRIPPPSN